MIGRCARCARPSHANICWRCRRAMFIKSVESGADGSSVAVLATVPDSSLAEDLRRIQAAASMRNEWRTKAEYDDQLGEDEHEKDRQS